MAEEAEIGTDAAAAQEIIGEVFDYTSLMFAGMMADCADEHRRTKNETDRGDFDVIELGPELASFKARLKVLFVDGLIFSKGMTQSFTA